MHELTLTQSMLDLALRQGQEVAAKRIVKIHLQVGALSCVTPHAIEFCFSVLAKDTLAEHAQLSFTRSAAQGVCRICGAQFEAQDYLVACPVCQHDVVALSGGDELMMVSIEVDLCV